MNMSSAPRLAVQRIGLNLATPSTRPTYIDLNMSECLFRVALIES